MSEVELELSLKIEKALSSLAGLKADYSNLGEVTKKVTQDMTQAFKKPGTELNNLLNSIKPVSGSLIELQLKLEKLTDKAVNIKIGTEEFNKLKKEIKETQDEISVATGKFDEFGNRIRKGAGESIHALFEVGAAVAGAFNLAALAGFGEKVGKESEAAEKAIKGLAVVESLRAVGIGFLKAQELALEAVEKAKNITTAIATTLTKAQAFVTAILTGEMTLATAATVAFTTAIEFLTGPIGIFLALLTASWLAMEAFSDETKKDTDALLENTKAVLDATKARNELLNKIDELKDKIAVEQGALTDNEAEKGKIIREFFRQREELELEHETALIELRSKANLESEEGQREYNRKVEDLDNKFYTTQQLRFKAYKESLVLIDAKTAREAADQAEKDRKKAEQKAKQDAEKLLQLRKQLAAAFKELDARENKAISENLGGQERLKFEAELALKELDVFKKGLIEKGKLLDSSFQLSAEQENQFAIIKLGIQNKYFRDSNDLLLENEGVRAQLITDNLERELQVFNVGFAKVEKQLREAGATEDEILNLRRRGRRDIIIKYNDDELKITEQVLLNEQDARERGAVNEIEFTRTVEEAKLEIIIQFAKKRLNILNTDPEKNRLEISALKKAITEAQNELQTLQDTAPEFSLAALLGIKGKNGSGLSKEQEQEINESFRSIYSNIVTIANQALEVRRQQVEQEKQFNQQIIDDLNNRVAEEERALDREMRNRDKGYANNVDGERAALEKIKKERDKALEDKKRIAAEEKKLAKEQAAIEALQQVAALLTAGAKLFSKETSRGGAYGVVIAIAAIAAMVASFLSLKSSVQKATLGEGGWIKGKSHSQGGVDINAEGDEFVVKKSKAKKHSRILEAINSGDTSNLKAPDIAHLLRGTGVMMATDEVDEVNKRSNFLRLSDSSSLSTTRQLEKKIEEQTIELKGLRKELKEKPQLFTDKDGTKIIKKGSHTVVIKK